MKTDNALSLFHFPSNNKKRSKFYLSFMRIRTFPASSLAFISTTLLACSLKSETILLEIVCSRSNSDREAENARAAFSVSRLYSLLMHAQESLSPVSSMDCTGPAIASDSFFCNNKMVKGQKIWIECSELTMTSRGCKIKESNLIVSFQFCQFYVPNRFYMNLYMFLQFIPSF